MYGPWIYQDMNLFEKNGEVRTYACWHKMMYVFIYNIIIMIFIGLQTILSRDDGVGVHI